MAGIAGDAYAEDELQAAHDDEHLLACVAVLFWQPHGEHMESGVNSQNTGMKAGNSSTSVLQSG